MVLEILSWSVETWPRAVFCGMVVVLMIDAFTTIVQNITIVVREKNKK